MTVTQIYRVGLRPAAYFVIASLAIAARGEAQQALRFPVAHMHTLSVCYGYLYITADEVRYQAVRPQSDQHHSFTTSLRDVESAQRWVLFGSPQDVAELRVGRATYRFRVLADTTGVETAAPGGAPTTSPDGLLAAIQDPAAALAAAQGNGASPLDTAGSAGPVAGPPPAATPAAAFGQSADRFAGTTPRPEGPNYTHGVVGYVPPAGWTIQSGGNGVTVLNGPVKPEEQPCQIMMLPPMPVQGDLATQAAALVEGVAAANDLGPYRDDSDRDVRLSSEEGISGTGWAYADLSGQLGRSGVTVRVLMAQMGDQVLPILGYSRTWNCLGNQAERDNDVWALLFHSLQLPGYTKDSPHLAKELIGTWSSASGSAGNSETFAPNGRFGSVAVYQSYVPSSTPGMVWEIARSWQGDGPYEVRGDRLHTQNPNGSDTERDVTRLFSIVRTPNENEPGGFDFVLRMVKRSWDGSQTWGFSPSGNYVTHMIKENPARP